MIVTALLEWLAAVALVLLCAIGALFTRRVVIRRRGGTFDCSLRLTPGSARAAVHFGQSHARANGEARSGLHEPYQAHAAHEGEPHRRGTRTPLSASAVRAGRGWSYGIAQYENDRIDWYRIFSYAYRPAAVLTRRDLEVVARRDTEGQEELALFPGWTIVECKFGTGLVELAMSPDALTGFLSWLEAAPPGQDVSRVS
ncbi:MAG TPA: DUF2550 domain-containing protein [Actinocrinis sp.]|nr:DUF2550 domain-containing protein [Actinocrinis sp.]